MYEVAHIKKPVKFSLNVPGSKSITNRIFLIASLAKGSSSIKNALLSDDTRLMRESLEKLGIDIRLKKDKVFIKGCNGRFPGQKKEELFLGNSGTAVRFLTAAMALRKGQTKILGSERMYERPIQDLLYGLDQLGVKTKSINENGCPPIIIKGTGRIQGKEIEIPGNISSQFISALLMIAPFARKETVINILGPIVSKPYIDITIQIMKKFGVKVQNEDYRTFKVKPQRYKSKRIEVEGDASSASYFYALSAITGGRANVKNVSYTSAQGDIRFVDLLERMGCKVKRSRKGQVTVEGTRKLRALGEFTMSDMPDSALTLAIVASFAEGKTVIRGIRNLRYKETDRIRALVTELSRVGVRAKQLPDGVEISGGKIHGGKIETYNDHRIAMCFGILGCRVKGIKIINPECVEKTYPSFFEDLEKATKKAR